LNRLGLTGASGYIGQALCRLAASHGWQVVALGRGAVQGCIEWRPADLRKVPERALLAGLDAVVHLAANTQGDHMGADAEYQFAVALARHAQAQGQCLVYCSSQSADKNAPSAYGRSKFAIETALLSANAIVIRPGMVLGGQPGGLFGALLGLVRQLPILPDLRPRPMLWPVHVDSVAEAFLSAAMQPELGGQIFYAAGGAVSFKELLQALAWRARVSARFAPVPLLALRLPLRVAGRFFGARCSAERLDSLARLPIISAQAQRIPGWSPGTWPQAVLRRRESNRALLEEAAHLCQAAIGARAPLSLLRRYVQHLRVRDNAHALYLPWQLGSPLMLASLDPMSPTRDPALLELRWRQHLMWRLIEVEPTLTDAFLYPAGPPQRLRAVRDVLRAGWRELSARLRRPFAVRRFRSRP